LKRTQGILSEMCVTLLFFQDGYERLHKITFLKKVTSTQALVTQCVDKSHGVFKNTSVTLQQQFINNLVLVFGSFVGTV
jgi:hypothetical protein